MEVCSYLDLTERETVNRRVGLKNFVSIIMSLCLMVSFSVSSAVESTHEDLACIKGGYFLGNMSSELCRKEGGQSLEQWTDY